MVQALGVIIILILTKLLFDFLKEQFARPNQPGKGDVIDISNAWIDTTAMPYNSKDNLFNAKELHIYRMLNDLLAGNNYTVCPRMRMADLLAVPGETENRQEYLNRINERSLDLVILEASQLKPLVVFKLELPNDGRKKQLNDRFIEKVLAAVKLPLITLNLNNPPDQTQLASQLRNVGLDVL